MNRFGFRAILFIGLLTAQPGIRDQLYHQPPEKVVPGDDVTLELTVRKSVGIVSGQIFFRPPHGDAFSEIDMDYTGTGWAGTITGNRIPGSGIEYFLAFQLRGGGLISFPEHEPNNDPYFVPADFGAVQKIGFGNQRRVVKQESVEENVLIISPEPNSIVPPENIVIAASMFYSEDIDTTDIRLIIDNKPIKSGIQYSEGVFTAVLSSLPAGKHTVSIRMTTRHGIPIKPIEWTFRIVDETVKITDEINLKGKLGTRFSTEQTSGLTKNISEVSGQLSSGLEWVDAKTQFRITSRENKYQQPFNRLGAKVRFGNYLTINMGDFSPSISPFMIDGNRVRGIGVDVQFPWFRVQVIQGELNRAVQENGDVNGGYTLQTANIISDSLGHYTYPIDRAGYTFQRSMSLYELTLKIPDRFHWRISALKAKDDMETVNPTIRSSAKLTVDSLATNLIPGTYTLSQFINMVDTTGGAVKMLSDHWGDGDPNDNLVLGTTFQSILDQQHLIFEFSWNFSMFNRNIWDGAVSRTQMDTTLDDSLDGFIGVNYDDNHLVTEGSLFIDTSKVFDPTIYENYFTINQYMTPLIPFDYPSFSAHPIATIINMPSSAFHFKLNGSYSFQTFQVLYRQIGPEFVSLGNPYLSTNIREFVATDRFSLLDRKLNMSLTYKFHDNKILSTTVDPLVTHSLILNFSLNPGPTVPSIMANIQSIGKTNEKTTVDIIGDTRQDLREDYRTINSLFSANVPFLWGGYRQMLTINYTTVQNHDLLQALRASNFVFNKTNTDGFSVNLSTRFNENWRMLSNLSRSNLYLPLLDTDGNIIQKPYSWTAAGVNSLNNFKDNHLRFNGGLIFIRSAGDINSNIYGLKSAVEYDIIQNLVVSTSLNLQLSQIPSYRKDGVDNNGNGKTDELFEPWSWSSSGLFVNLKYTF